MSAAVRNSVLVTFAGAAGAVAPIVFFDSLAPLGNARFAIAALGAVTALGGFLFTIMFFGRGRLRDRLIAGKDLLAHWKYTDAEWRAFAKEEAVVQARGRSFLLGVTAVIMLIATLFSLAKDPKAGIFVGVIMAVLWVICWIVARASGRERRDSTHVPEVLIGKDGLLCGQELHAWRGWSLRLDECAILAEPCLQLRLSYSAQTRTGRNTTVVRVPIPAGKEPEARAVIQTLKP